jgi:hypothetical protein
MEQGRKDGHENQRGNCGGQQPADHGYRKGLEYREPTAGFSATVIKAKTVVATAMRIGRRRTERPNAGRRASLPPQTAGVVAR